MNWIEKNEILDALLNKEETLTADSMDQGFEAEVLKISSNKESFVLKVWNKNSKPDIRFQYRLLNELHECGLPVSKPIGWGIDPHGNKVLFTSFDGTRVFRLDDKKMTEIANILSSIHRINPEKLTSTSLPKYDFIDYFFYEARKYEDIYNALIPLVQQAQMKQDRLIHGDFHLNNLLEDQGKYSVIDWTNGQLGDFRYDFAWSLLLLKIYVPEQFVEIFYSAYLMDNNISYEELQVYEALALLRWMTLNRIAATPLVPDIKVRVKSFISSNPYLNELEFTGF
ncbi:aminoglycoside phosphotransferase family protein [Paenibacillus sp. GCM10028914]|uniref:aminoglycoside phosphotransferase family protein n=1 Tax=Paenibacillus sp. GCM10028914 TaxID=3273416 RepID=UPI00361709D8